jgi:hypothetical protein
MRWVAVAGAVLVAALVSGCATSDGEPAAAGATAPAAGVAAPAPSDTAAEAGNDAVGPATVTTVVRTSTTAARPVSTSTTAARPVSASTTAAVPTTAAASAPGPTTTTAGIVPTPSTAPGGGSPTTAAPVAPCALAGEAQALVAGDAGAAVALLVRAQSLVGQGGVAADAELRALLPEARRTGPGLARLGDVLGRLRTAVPDLAGPLEPAGRAAATLGAALAAVERIDDLAAATAAVGAADASVAADAAAVVGGWRTANCPA